MDSKTGRLEVILGPMFSNKSTELLRRLSTYAAVHLRVLYINHATDKRSDLKFSTHSSILSSREEDYKFDKIKLVKLSDISSDVISTYDVIGCDEGQFFEDLLTCIPRYVDELNKTVIVAGLDGSFQREKFGDVVDLIRYADSVIKLTALCRSCPKESVKPAIFTHRTTKEKEAVVVGGGDKYEALCRECYLRKSRFGSSITEADRSYLSTEFNISQRNEEPKLYTVILSFTQAANEMPEYLKTHKFEQVAENRYAVRLTRDEISLAHLDRNVRVWEW